MEWTKSDTLALALDSCAYCRGVGLVASHRGKMAPCKCVLRSIFRVCFRRFRTCVTEGRHVSHVSLDIAPGNGGRATWSRKIEEYIADFTLVTKRTLSEEEYRLFRFHYMLGADWRLCCKRLKIERGVFFHAVYRIESKLGLVFRELQPYSLFPVDEYFSGTSGERRGPQSPPPQCMPIRVPGFDFGHKEDEEEQYMPLPKAA